LRCVSPEESRGVFRGHVTISSGACDKRITAVNFVEASVVIETRKGAAGLVELDRLIELSGIEIAAVDERLAKEARTAYRHYGKGRHPARLILGDCFTYALAKTRDEPVLCTGRDFAKTDLSVVN
jgi:ribonuclease VapC